MVGRKHARTCDQRRFHHLPRPLHRTDRQGLTSCCSVRLLLPICEMEGEGEGWNELMPRKTRRDAHKKVRQMCYPSEHRCGVITKLEVPQRCGLGLNSGLFEHVGTGRGNARTEFRRQIRRSWRNILQNVYGGKTRHVAEKYETITRGADKRTGKKSK